MMLIFTFGLLATMVVGYKADTRPIFIIKSAQIIDEVNKNPENTWKADSYGVAEMDAHIFAKTRLGAKLDTAEKSSHYTTETHRTTASDDDLPDVHLPVNFSWIDSKRINCPIGKIRDQSNCGSCWAVSTASAFSDRLCLKSKGKIRIPLSSSYIASCDFSNHGCEGGYMDRVYNFLKYNGTITGGEFDSDEGCQPYPIRPCGNKPHLMPCAKTYTPKCRQTTCTNNWYPHKEEETIYRVKNWRFLKDEYSARKELYENGPITASFLVYSDFVFYKSGIYSPTSHTLLGGHAVRIVGWGEENGIKYWLVANSWGTDWGEKGYFKIIRGVNSCGFERGLQSLIPDI